MSHRNSAATRVFCGRILAFLALSALTAACSASAPEDPETLQSREAAFLDGDGIGVGVGEDGLSVKAHVCGEVKAYVASSGETEGSLDIDGKNYKIAKGATASGMESVKVGAEVCCDLELLASNGLCVDVFCKAEVSVDVKICGKLEAYVAATSTDDGWCQIGGKKYPIKAGTTFENEALLKVGAEICLQTSLDVDGKIGGLAVVSEDGVKVKARVCGEVDAYAAASASAEGKLIIDGHDYKLVAGAQVEGEACLDVDAKVCCDLALFANDDKLAAHASCEVDVSVDFQVCGKVEAYVAATSTNDGWCQIGGKKYPIKAGTTFENEALLKVGAEVCIKGSLDVDGKIGGLAVVSEDGIKVKARVCGEVDAYAAASASAEGKLIIDGHDYKLVAGAQVEGEACLDVDAKVCCDLALFANDDKLAAHASCEVDVSVDFQVCGKVEAYVAATASVDGWVKIGGKKHIIKAGTTIEGEIFLKVGAEVCIKASLDIDGKIKGHLVIIDKSHHGGSDCGWGSGSDCGSGDGSGDGSGEGGGDGSGDGSGDGGGDTGGDTGHGGSYGGGHGDGSGDGHGDGHGDGSGDGRGDEGCLNCLGGYGMGDGAGHGDGSGDGSGDGRGDGHGDGRGDGHGDGRGDGKDGKKMSLPGNHGDKGDAMNGCSVPLAGTTGGAGGWLCLALGGLVAARRKRAA